MVSGKSINKFIKTNLTPVKSKTIDAPYVEEFSYSLECSLLHTIDLGLHTQFIGQIVNVIADENVLGEKGLPDIEKTQPLIYGSQGSSFYYSLGQRIGKGFSLGNSIKDR